VEFRATVSRTSWINSLMISLLMFVTGTTVITWLVRQQIAAPLMRVSSALGASMTELTQANLNTVHSE
jgi:hypothetical protein